MARNKELSSETLFLFMREIAMKLKISYTAVYYSLRRTAQTGTNQNRKSSGRPGAQLSKRRVSRVELQSSTGSFMKYSPQNTSLDCPVSVFFCPS
jgi:hypothetical protein